MVHRRLAVATLPAQAPTSNAGSSSRPNDGIRWKSKSSDCDLLVPHLLGDDDLVHWRQFCQQFVLRTERDLVLVHGHL